MAYATSLKSMDRYKKTAHRKNDKRSWVHIQNLAGDAVCASKLLRPQSSQEIGKTARRAQVSGGDLKA